MRDRIEQIIAQIKEQYAKLSKKTKIIILSSLAALVVFVIAGFVLLNSAGYETIYFDLVDTEVAEISAKLTELEIEFKISGDSISVPAEQVDQIRASFASQGYPKTGLTYDTFKDNVGIMTPNDEKTFFELADLQDRMGATIRMLDGVEEAVVEIALAENENYILEDDKEESHASVVVRMRDESSPPPEMAKSIQRIVAFGVPGMKMENVSVIDSSGNTVSGEYGQVGTADLKRSLEIEVENSTKNKILSHLETIYGKEHVRVTVTANVNVDKTLSEILTYIPTTDDNKGVMDSESEGREFINDGGVEGGIPGAETNADFPIYGGVEGTEGEVYYKDQRDIDYLVSKMKEQIQSDSGMLTDLTVSAAVNSDVIEENQVDGLKEFIAGTAGIPLNETDEKVVIFTAKFADTEGEPLGFLESIKQNPLSFLPYLIGIIAFIVVIIVSIVLLIKKKKKAEEEEELLLQGIMNANLEPLQDLKDVGKSREMELKDQIKEFAEINPEIAAHIIKAWIKGGDN